MPAPALVSRVEVRIGLAFWIVAGTAAALTGAFWEWLPYAAPVGALVLALAGFFSARQFDPEREDRTGHSAITEAFAKSASIVLFVWAAAWWLFAGIDAVAPC